MITDTLLTLSDVWIERIEKAVKTELLAAAHEDGSHDLGHLLRVSALSRRFAREESANELVTFTAGMLHDIVNLPKNHPESYKSSLFAADRAKEILMQLAFPEDLIPDVCHAIHAHSFSAKVEPKTIEAKCLQDADRMEALGALGLMRVFYVSGKFNSQILDERDPEGLNRELDDKKFALDHFVLKLLTLHGTMKTCIGRKTAESLSRYMQDFRNGIIKDHLEGHRDSGCFIIAQAYQLAGQRNMQLFHSDDPFSESGRSLNDNRYALDSLLIRNEETVRKFIEQLRLELAST